MSIYFYVLKQWNTFSGGSYGIWREQTLLEKYTARFFRSLQQTLNARMLSWGSGSPAFEIYT